MIICGVKRFQYKKRLRNDALHSCPFEGCGGLGDTKSWGGYTIRSRSVLLRVRQEKLQKNLSSPSDIKGENWHFFSFKTWKVLLGAGGSIGRAWAKELERETEKGSMNGVLHLPFDRSVMCTQSIHLGSFDSPGKAGS